MIARTDFLKLAKLDAEAFKSRARRGLLPFAEPGTPFRSPGAYTLFDAFLTILTDDLADEGFGFGVAQAKACVIIGAAAPLLRTQWQRIAGTGTSLFYGSQPEGGEILCGRAVVAGGNTLSVCGTLAEIARETEALGPPVRLVLTNASRAAAVLRMRAAREGIDVSELFPEDAHG